jgi:hypothetical protein
MVSVSVSSIAGNQPQGGVLILMEASRVLDGADGAGFGGANERDTEEQREGSSGSGSD